MKSGGGGSSPDPLDCLARVVPYSKVDPVDGRWCSGQGKAGPDIVPVVVELPVQCDLQLQLS